jgi:hypothetical protein
VRLSEKIEESPALRINQQKWILLNPDLRFAINVILKITNAGHFIPQRKDVILKPAKSSTRSTTVAATSSIVFGRL